MELLSNLGVGLSAALQPESLFYCFLGTLLGTLIGVLPGVGPTATMAMLLPITFSLEPLSALIMLAGIYYGAQYGGSTTAILINLPGESSSAVTAIDGYQMAQKGQAGPALTIAALGSFVAGTVATFLIAATAIPLTRFALRFGSPEYFSLMLLGLIASIALAHGSFFKALGMIVLGLLLGLVGTDIYTATPRFTFGFLELADGLDFVAVAVGLFGLAEILRNLEGQSPRPVSSVALRSLMPSRSQARRSVGPILRGTAIGSVLGILPGSGSLLGAFGAYALEKKISKHPEEFGKGAIEGVAAPESANNAGAQTSFIPMLTLGVPSNAVMGLMIGAMMIQGIIPGPAVATQQPALFWGLIASMWLGNLMLVILNLPLVGIWVKIASLPYHILFPAILALSAIGVYSMDQNVISLFLVTLFGFAGYLLIKLGCEPVPFLLGFILGPLLEEHLRRAMIMSKGDPMIFLDRPISATLILATAGLIAFMLFPTIRRKRDKVFVED